MCDADDMFEAEVARLEQEKVELDKAYDRGVERAEKSRRRRDEDTRDRERSARRGTSTARDMSAPLQAKGSGGGDGKPGGSRQTVPPVRRVPPEDAGSPGATPMSARIRAFEQFQR